MDIKVEDKYGGERISLRCLPRVKRSGKYMKKYLWDSLKVKCNQSGIECNKNYHYIDRYLNHTNKTA